MNRFIYKESDIDFGLLTSEEKERLQDFRFDLLKKMEQDPEIILLNKAVKEDIPRIRESLFKERKLTQKDLDNYMFSGYTDKTFECEQFLSNLRQKVKQAIPDLGRLLNYKEKLLANIEQEYLYRCMKVVRPRMDSVDAMGKPVLSSQEWMEKFSNLNGDATKSKELLTGYFDKSIRLADGIGSPDVHIAPFVKRLQEAGCQVLRAHSGTVGSSPGIRIPIIENNYPAGSHPSHGFLANMTKIDVVLRNPDRCPLTFLAIKAGWNEETINEKGLEITRFTLPVCNKFPDMTYEGIIKAAEMSGKQPYDLINKYGGPVIYTDRMVLDRLEDLTRVLEQEQSIKEDLRQAERVTDIKAVYQGKYPYKQINVSCCIDGLQQPSVMLYIQDRKNVEGLKDSPHLPLLLEQLAHHYYSDALKNDEQQRKGLVR